MKNKKSLFSVTLASTFLFLYLIFISSSVVEGKDSRNMSTPNIEIKLEPIYDTEYSHVEIFPRLTSGSMYSVDVTVKNMGTEIWNKDGKESVYISYHWKNANGTVVHDGLRTPLPYNVRPGDTISSRILIKTPDQKGNYTLVIDLVKEGVCWFEAEGAKTFEKEVEISNSVLEQKGKLEYKTDYPEINKLQDLIVNTTNASA
ncbi:MAG TPA: hypothetical protein VGK06_04655, partial [Methanosarcina sp.]